ncbi:MAG: hypothetical protein ABJL99_10165 [Aliishimia sp.]
MFSHFIEMTRCEPFEWGQNDCALWCASAVKFVTGFDPASDLRGTYKTQFECRQKIIRAGGLLRLIQPRMIAPAICDFDQTLDGVAVVRADRRQLCALIVQGRAVLRMETGLRLVDDFEIVRGWSCLKH